MVSIRCISDASHALLTHLSTLSLLYRITKKVISGVYQGVTTVELDVRKHTSFLYAYFSYNLYRILRQRLQHTLLRLTPTMPFLPHASPFLTYTRRRRRSSVKSSMTSTRMVGIILLVVLLCSSLPCTQQ